MSPPPLPPFSSGPIGAPRLHFISLTTARAGPLQSGAIITSRLGT